MPNSKQQWQDKRNLLLSNPLIVASDKSETFRLDDTSFNYLQQLRNEIAVEKLNFQVDLDDPNYALKTVRLLAWFDGQLELAERLQTLHLENTTHMQEE